MKNERHTVISSPRERFQSRIRKSNVLCYFFRSVSNYNRLFTRALLGNKTGHLFTMYKNLRPTESRMLPRRFEEKFFALRIALPVGSSVDELHNEPKSRSK